VEVDLLELAKAKQHDVKIVVAAKRLETYSYLYEKKQVNAPPLETPLDIAVVLHELGHADQHEDERFKEIIPLYYFAQQSRPLGDLHKVAEAIPEARSEEVKGGIERLIQEAEELDKDIPHLKKRLASLERGKKTAARKSLEKLAGVSAREMEEISKACLEEITKLPKDEREDKKTEVIRKVVLDGMKDKGFKFSKETKRKLNLLTEEELSALEDDVGWFSIDYEVPLADLPLIPEGYISDWTDADNIGQKMFSEETVSRHEPKTKTLTLEFPVHFFYDFGDEKLRGVLEITDVSEDAYHSHEKNIRSFDEKAAQVKHEIATQADRLRKLKEAVDDIQSLPQRMMERDATRRALQWMKKLRQDSGIDLFRGVRVEKKVIMVGEEPEKCADSMKLGLAPGGKKYVETDIKAEMQKHLSTYGATTKEMRKKYGIIIPAAGSKRQSKK
ncbi:MAG: hypothetical protein ABII13_05440, partial [Patescibacteria group bacterium]|nr:hypothetical protein [Patescibacteria group bacterium]